MIGNEKFGKCWKDMEFFKNLKLDLLICTIWNFLDWLRQLDWLSQLDWLCQLDWLDDYITRLTKLTRLATFRKNCRNWENLMVD